MLSVASLTVCYKPSRIPMERILLNRVSLKVKPGRVTALVGESGCGKTMLVRSVIGALPSSVFRREGSILLSGEAGTLDLTECATETRKACITNHFGLIMQNPEGSLNPSMKIFQQLREAIPDAKDSKRRVEEALFQMGISDVARMMGAYPHELSGGMCQRAMLAMMMLKNPRFLIADEPTTALDMVNQARIMKAILTLQKISGMGVLLITHDLSLVMDIADDVYVMQSGQIVEHGDAKTLYEAPRHIYTRSLIGAMQPKEHEPRVRPGADVISTPIGGFSAKHLYKYYNKHLILKDVSFEVNPNEIVAIIGESGSGKSTLARIISGVEASQKGEQVYFQATKRTHDTFKKSVYRQKVQIVFQNAAQAVDPRYTVQQILEEPLKNFFKWGSADRKRAIEALLSDVGLENMDIHLKGHQLSGGQLQRVCLARALAAKPELLILDEFTASLDMIIRLRILDGVKKLQRQNGFSVIFITHDLDSVMRIADRFYVMKDGVLIDEVHKDNWHSWGHPYTQVLFESMPSGNPHAKNIIH